MQPVDADRFKTQVVSTVSKRAANTCSNPDCGAVTSGPTDEPTQSVSVGEAAHIYGARAGSARFVATMDSTERSDITNAIWLCRNCHKLVDDDPDQFPAGLLFEWRREHERQVAQLVGKAGARARERYMARHLGEFEQLSYLAEQIIIDRPQFWAHKLTSELLRVKTGPIFKRWDALKRGLYTLAMSTVPPAEVSQWLQARHQEQMLMASAVGNLVNGEFQAAWGDPDGEASDAEIVRVCGLFAEGCARLLSWEEQVRFSKLPDAFDEVQVLLSGLAGMQLDEIRKLPAHLASIVSGAPKPGVHHLSLTFDLPEGWDEKYSECLQRAFAALG